MTLTLTTYYTDHNIQPHDMLQDEDGRWYHNDEIDDGERVDYKRVYAPEEVQGIINNNN